MNIQTATFIIFVLFLISCDAYNDVAITQQEDVLASIIEVNKKDSIKAKQSEVYLETKLSDSLFITHRELKIYTVNIYQKTENEVIGFISLTDRYRFSDHLDSAVISDKYLGYNEFREYHHLDKDHRARFLENVDINESDSIYIYNYSLDSMYVYPVNSAPLMAHITIYGADSPVNQYNYLIGFDIGDDYSTDHDMSIYHYNFVSIGELNPFVTGDIHPIVWDKIETNDFPSVKLDSELSDQLKISKAIQTGRFTFNNFNYFIQDYDLGVRQIVVATAENRIVFNKIVNDGESTGFAPLSFTDAKNEYGPEQWTGNIFKNRPTAFFGFFYESFGCEWIDFIGMSEESFYIRCDNRH